MNRLISPAERIGNLLAQTIQKDPHFYFFSPDETTSNRFDKVFSATSRAWNLKTATWDLPAKPNGHLIEILSENVLFSVMTGHLMRGEPAMMGSYEAFFPIITSQLLQHLKFLKQSQSIAWRPPIPATNLLSTSTCWHQEHNGFTHQSPALISTLLSLPSNLANCYFPIDAPTAETIFKIMLQSQNVINLTTFNKTPLPIFTSKNTSLPPHGATILQSISDPNPDFIFTATGDIVAGEAITAMQILKQDLPSLSLRFVSLNTLSYRAIGPCHHKLTQSEFNSLFTTNKPIIANFHGYPLTLASIFETYTSHSRFKIHGFCEEGSTTTPFEMLRLNLASRYDLAIDVARILKRHDLVQKYQSIIHQNHLHATTYGTDLIT